MFKNISKKLIIIFAIIIMLFIIFILLWNKLSSTKNLSTKTSSNEFETLVEKLEFMGKYVNEFSEVIDTEYNIEYYDNSSGGLPGPSEWDIRIALKVPKESIIGWCDGFVIVSEDEVNLSWWDILELERKGWELDSEPDFYQRENQDVYLAVYEDEGVILKLISSMNVKY